MTNKKAPTAGTFNRRNFLRNAATAAGAVALGAPTAAGDSSESPRLPETPLSVAAWEEFQQHLAEVLPDLSEDEYLVITRKQTNQFVQFAAQGRHGMRAETVGNAYLERDAQLSADSVASLVTMGWHAPTLKPTRTSQEEDPPDGSPNFFVDAATPVPHGHLAALAVKALREVYRVGHPGQLEYIAASSVDEWVSIRFPSLGIKRESRG
jgi:T3SS (YopN, CesT) and YbjN peptide-binding chaperone 3